MSFLQKSAADPASQAEQTETEQRNCRAATQHPSLSDDEREVLIRQSSPRRPGYVRGSYSPFARFDYGPRLAGSTPAKVKKSIIRKLCGVPSCVGSVGIQFGCTVR